MGFPRFAAWLLGLGLLGLVASAQTYVLATPDSTLNTAGWALSSANLTGFRGAITNPANFGPGGTVSVSISIHDLAAVNTDTLAGASGFIAPWWSNAESAASVSTILTAFHAGMDLWLLEDDSSHNALGAALGLVSSPADGTVSNGTAPFFSGPFGTASNTGTFGNFAQFDAATVTALGGTVIGQNASGQITAVYWAKGAFAPGAGALVVFSDVDMISNWMQDPYSPSLNANGILALNTMAALAVPEPSTTMLLGFGLVPLLGACLGRWRRRRGDVSGPGKT